ncbi:MAG: endonuclease III [Candidatus Zixiibacteriota bacterium]|nr:MAG: endonuclease III [candidate division Zixibacteria bacterium]
MKPAKRICDSRIGDIISILKKEYPDARCTLDFKTPHQLLVATVLSAQCTDERVNIVTKDLFKKYRKPKDFAGADIRELEDDIRSTGFFRNKAKSIKESARIITNHYRGKMPDSMAKLVKLPGVGRKTASVILGTAFNKAEGIAVDTHVMRLSKRLGLTKQKDAATIEKDLMEIVPKSEWIIFSHLLISHGRAVCTARRPVCKSCVLMGLCSSARRFL